MESGGSVASSTVVFWLHQSEREAMTKKIPFSSFEINLDLDKVEAEICDMERHLVELNHQVLSACRELSKHQQKNDSSHGEFDSDEDQSKASEILRIKEAVADVKRQVGNLNEAIEGLKVVIDDWVTISKF